MRVFCGLTQNTTAQKGSNNPTGIAVLGFVYDAALGSNWRVLRNDGTSTGTLVDTGIAYEWSAPTTFKITYDGTTVRFFMDGTQVGTNYTTDIPTADGNSMFGLLGVTTTTTEPRTIIVQGMSLEYLEPW